MDDKLKNLKVGDRVYYGKMPVMITKVFKMSQNEDTEYEINNAKIVKWYNLTIKSTE